jgi:MYXO-CTERM domain-containing protein
MRKSIFLIPFVLLWSSAFAVPTTPDFTSATFDPDQPVDHPYFPLTATGTRVYNGMEDGEPIEERFELTNLGPGPIIAGVQTTIQRDRDYEDGLLVEETFDYYAQDTEGNVWYMGEDVTNFEYDDDGNLIEENSEGAWRAGVNDAQPGFIMPADPEIGFNYYQEFAPEDDALDQATIFAFLDMLEVGGMTFEDVLQIFETNELEPDAREFKYYAAGFGLILVEEDLNEDLEEPEVVFALAGEATSVPEPGPFGLLLLALLPMLARRRRTVLSDPRAV